MNVAYVDTSCLVALALNDPAARKVRKWLTRCDRRLASNLLEAELRAVLRREGIDGVDEALFASLRWVMPTRPLRDEFVRLLARGYVRGADLWHIACALFVRETIPDLVFLTLDRRQETLARSMDFTTIL